jgi:hypothetical protein
MAGNPPAQLWQGVGRLMAREWVEMEGRSLYEAGNWKGKLKLELRRSPGVRKSVPSEAFRRGGRSAGRSGVREEQAEA